ncbi:hypothetical protein MHU86_2687 [Fragilaria crotonensis]|nr:hypothetical protein MHU86_2687 [Fragilaria crotonensis]
MFAFAVRGSFSFEVQLFSTTSSPKAKEAKETKEEQDDGIRSSGPNGICARTPTGTGVIAVLRLARLLFSGLTQASNMLLVMTTSCSNVANIPMKCTVLEKVILIWMLLLWIAFSQEVVLLLKCTTRRKAKMQPGMLLLLLCKHVCSMMWML